MAVMVEGPCVVEDEVGERPAGLEAHDLVDLTDPGGEQRREGVELLAHLAVLGAEPGVDPHRALAVGTVGDGDAGGLLPVGEPGHAGGGG